MVLGIATTFVACEKNKQPLVLQNAKPVMKIPLSNAILDYDNKVKSSPRIIAWTEKDTKMLIKVALADCSSAWQAYKYVAVVLTPGYGGAAALLAGIGGSLFTWWMEKDSAPAKKQNANVAVTQSPGSPLIIGELHNKYIEKVLVQGNMETTNIDSFTTMTYDSLIGKISTELGLQESVLSNDFTMNEYRNLMNNRASYSTIEGIYNQSIQDGMPTYLCTYFKEYLNRVANENTFVYNDVMTYSDLFIENINAQSNISAYDKHYLSSVISVYKNSIKYWSVELDK